MDLQGFLDHMNSGKLVETGTPAQEWMNALAQEALKVTAELNSGYHTPEEICEIFSRLTGKPLDPTFRLFPPFYTDCGKNLTVGKHVFFNSGCRVQDQGGVRIGDGTLIGHNVVLATLNHHPDPARRADMIPRADPYREECLDRIQCDRPAGGDHRRRRDRSRRRGGDEGRPGQYRCGRRPGKGDPPDRDSGEIGTERNIPGQKPRFFHKRHAAIGSHCFDAVD